MSESSFTASGPWGDTLLTLPAMGALRLRYPGAHITLAAHPGYAAPLKDAGRVDAVLDAGSVPFHLLQLTPPAGEDELDRLLARFSIVILFARDPEKEKVHTAGWLRRSLKPLGVSPEALARIAKDYCRKSPTQPFLIRGPADGETCEVFLGHWGDALPILETSRLEVLAGALADMGAYLGPDT